jgi:hypothetical protein
LSVSIVYHLLLWLAISPLLFYGRINLLNWVTPSAGLLDIVSCMARFAASFVCRKWCACVAGGQAFLFIMWIVVRLTWLW